MVDSDRREFAELLTATMQVYGAQLGTAAIGIWWSALACYSIEQVRSGLSAHVKHTERGRFAPRPADVIAQLSAHDGRPGPDEAWAQCPFTEAATVVWTNEMRYALAAAQPLLDEGDSIAARMAFKDAYVREVDAARRAGTPIHWEVSLGHHEPSREIAVARAVELGRIGLADAQRLLPCADLGVADAPALPAPPERPTAIGEALRNLARSMRERVAEKAVEQQAMPADYGEEYWMGRSQGGAA